LLQSGGVVMVILGILSIITITLVVYALMRLQVSKLIPLELAHQLIGRLKKGDYIQARGLCEDDDSLVAAVVLAGLDKTGRGPEAVQESVEIAARKEVAALWTSLNHLADIAAIAPMLGLLGTVIGMIEAFNTIAFQSAVVKPILLAGGVSKAMVTTAGGMAIGIVAMIFYSLLRFRTQNVTNVLETVISEILEAFGSSGKKEG